MSLPEKLQKNFEYVLARLDENPATSGIRLKTQDASYNRIIAEQICNITFNVCGKNNANFNEAIENLIELSLDFINLQTELEKTGQYKYQSFAEVQNDVLGNAGLMPKKYLNGLLLSQAFWVNHLRILEFFIDEFCQKTTQRGGRVIEVPVGTGIFLSEFLLFNNGWSAEGYDISDYSVNYARSLLTEHNSAVKNLYIAQGDVFGLDEGSKYDAVICGELLEHLEKPQNLLTKLRKLITKDGFVFLTAAIYAAHIDHIYLFNSASEAREMILNEFTIENELVLPVYPDKSPTDHRTPINYACIVKPRVSAI